MGSYHLSFELDELPPSLNVFMRWNWRKRNACFKILKQKCLFKIGKQKPENPLEKFQITFTRHTMRPLDFDNLVASFKPIMDSLVVGKIIIDDSWTLTNKLNVYQVKVSKKADQRITIEVKSV